jgi:hypothetical protein
MLYIQALRDDQSLIEHFEQVPDLRFAALNRSQIMSAMAPTTSVTVRICWSICEIAITRSDHSLANNPRE